MAPALVENLTRAQHVARVAREPGSRATTSTLQRNRTCRRTHRVRAAGRAARRQGRVSSPRQTRHRVVFGERHRGVEHLFLGLEVVRTPEALVSARAATSATRTSWKPRSAIVSNAARAICARRRSLVFGRGLTQASSDVRGSQRNPLARPDGRTPSGSWCCAGRADVDRAPAFALLAARWRGTSLQVPRDEYPGVQGRVLGPEQEPCPPRVARLRGAASPRKQFIVCPASADPDPGKEKAPQCGASRMRRRGLEPPPGYPGPGPQPGNPGSDPSYASRSPESSGIWTK